jgi:hypothetical protein
MPQAHNFLLSRGGAEGERCQAHRFLSPLDKVLVPGSLLSTFHVSERKRFFVLSDQSVQLKKQSSCLDVRIFLGSCGKKMFRPNGI